MIRDEIPGLVEPAQASSAPLMRWRILLATAAQGAQKSVEQFTFQSPQLKCLCQEGL